MFYVEKSFEIAGSHRLRLNYDSKCQNLHGHNWKIIVFCESEQLDDNGMVVDFTEIKRKIHDKLDHKHLNDVVDFNPTAENIAKWVVEQIPKAYRCDVIESNGNKASYES